jgi:hypothetical protein
MYPLMERHDFALQMQKNFIKDIETNKPKYLLGVNISDSWGVVNPNSFTMLFEWVKDYKQRNYRLVGVIELCPERAIYHWQPNVKWPVFSQNWVAVFERKI